MQIDAHQHFWHPGRGDYAWMPKDNPTLNRPYAPADLAPQLQAAGIDGTILVQAAATVNETEYMLGLADAMPWVKGVVGWVDFENPAAAADLSRLKAHPAFKGVRPMIQDIPDDAWMHRDDVQWAYRALIDHDLTFDALGFPRHLDHFLQLLKRYPDLRVVIDHCMKPQIATHSPASFQHWADGMSRIAHETRAVCKFSALITEANADWTLADLKPYADHIIAAFGADRVMWGSDWPVCRLRGEYADWHAAARSLTAHLPAPDRTMIFGGTARAFYRI
ncbi:MAG: amidohydrolase family protein [Paracoccaceae bacterium]